MTALGKNPSPIGLVGFGVAAVCSGLTFLEYPDPFLGAVTVPCAALQIFAGVIHLLRRENAFAALVFLFYGLVWLSLAATPASIPKFSFFLLLVCAISSLLTFIALRRNMMLPVKLGMMALAAFVLMFPFDAFTKIGGIILIFAGVVAFYILAAEVINTELRTEMLPGISRPFKIFAVAKPRVAPASDQPEHHYSEEPMHMKQGVPVDEQDVEHSLVVPVLPPPPRACIDLNDFAYDSESNTLQVVLCRTGGQVAYTSRASVDVWFQAVRKKVGELGTKVHAELNYDGGIFGPGVKEYWDEQNTKLIEECFLSVDEEAPAFCTAF